MWAWALEDVGKDDADVKCDWVGQQQHWISNVWQSQSRLGLSMVEDYSLDSSRRYAQLESAQERLTTRVMVAERQHMVAERQHMVADAVTASGCYSQ